MFAKLIDKIHNIIVEANMIFRTPIFGINTKPAKKVPNMLPIVDNEDIFPEVVPTLSIF